MNRSSPMCLIVLALLAATTVAQVPIGGSISDGAGGPLQSGVVYHVATLTVPPGTTLTIQPGAILKMNFDATLSVAGNLVVAGTSGSPVVVTSLPDDTAGGDTNGDGPSVGAPDWWRTLIFNNGSSGTISHLQLRHAGRFSNAGIELNTAVVSLSDCVISECAHAALDLNTNTAGSSTVADCQFDDCETAVVGVPLSRLPTFTDNTASGNVVHDSIFVSNGTLSSGTTTINAANTISNVFISSNIHVMSSASLAIDQDVIVKFLFDAQLTVDGTLTCTGAAGSPVILTTIFDDGHGGDTNKDAAATAGAANQWRTAIFSASASASSLTETELWYAGRFGNAGIEINGAAITLDSCRVRDCAGAALDMNNVEADVSVTGCHFQGCNRAVEGVPLESLNGFLLNTASGNLLHDSLAVSSASITGTTAVTRDNMISNVIICPNISVAGGATLTFDEGCIVKFLFDSSATIDGDLICNGTQGDPVIFTALLDDAHGGDTNNDGANTVPTPDQWRALFFSATSSSVLTRTQVWYAGRFNNAGIEISGAPATFDSCSVNSCSKAGLDMNNVQAPGLTVSDCAFVGNGRAVEGVPLASVPSFQDNTASNNVTHDTLDVSSGNITAGVTSITTSNTISSVIYCPNITVAAGAKLALGAGTIVKVKFDTNITISGELECLGSPGSPVVFTDERDDDHGGDTNKDGPSSGVGDWWRTITFGVGSAASRLENTIVRYTGRFSNPALGVADDITLISCTIDSGAHEGIDLGASAARPIIEDCHVMNCGGIAYEGLRWASCENFSDNQASGNGGNYGRITSTAVGVADRVRKHAVPAGVLVMVANPSFTAGSSLVLDAGVLVKVAFDTAVVVGQGSFEARGTGFDPVVFTDFRDDDFGGDTNGDGASTGAADWWRTFSVNAGATHAVLDHLVVRFAGRFSNPGVHLDNVSAEVRSLRVDGCGHEGVSILAMAGDAVNWIVSDCGLEGIELGATAGSVAHATVSGCAGGGISAAPTWTGSVTNTICWDNPAGNFVNMNDTVIFSSNGSPTAAGMNGNLNIDPMFTDASMGDFTLLSGSPCIGVADVGAADMIQEDHLEASRRSDDDLSGFLLPDMGALEKITWNLDVQGEAAIGGAQTYAFTGPMTAVGALLVTPLNEVHTFFANYGWLLVSPPGEVTLISSMAPGVPLVAMIPDLPVLVDYPFQAQAIVLDLTNPMRGNFTQRYRTRIRP